MTKVIYVLLAITLISCISFAACAKPTPTPQPSPATTSQPIVTPAPQPSPATTSQPIVTPTLQPSPAPTTTSQYGGTLVILLTGAVKNLGYPPELSGTTSASDPALEKLIYYDKDGRPIPGLATAWQIAPDSKSITFTLRKGVKFHDGTDFNAAAVKSNLLARQAAKRGDLDRMTSIDIIDDYTVRLNLSKWDSSLMENMGTYTGYIASPAAIEKNGKDWALANPVGTGPFQFVSWVRDQSVKYKKFAGYWDKGKPYLDAMEFRFFADETTKLMSFEAREGQLIAPVQPSDVALLSVAYILKVVPSLNPAGVFMVADSKNTDSPYSNVKVRQAVDYAIDKKAICDNIFYGVYTPLLQPVSPTCPGYVPGLAREYNPAKAKQLLADAGYRDGFKTTLVSRSDFNQDMSVAIQTYLKAVGIDTAIELIDTGKYYDYQYGGWKNKLIISRGFPGINPFTGWQVGFSTTARFASSTLRVPGFQDLLDKAMSEPDYDKIIAMAKQMTQLMFDQAMFNGIYQASFLTGYAKSVHDANWEYLGGVNWTPANAWLSK